MITSANHHFTSSWKIWGGQWPPLAPPPSSAGPVVSSLYFHSTKHRLHRESNQYCKCSYNFDLEKNARKHLKFSRRKWKVNIQYSLCNPKFTKKSLFREQFESVHEGKKPHKCSLCDYASSRKENLNKHIQSVHEGKKPHKCLLCDFACSQKVHLKSHIQSIHQGYKSHN